MTDEQLQALMDEAARAYRVPADVPLDRMWVRVERELFDVPAAPSRARRWLAPAVGIAATLVIGIGIGRMSVAGMGGERAAQRGLGMAAATANPGGASAIDGVSQDAAAQVAGSRVSDPLHRTTSAYLEDAEILLASMPSESKGVDAAFVRDAHRLLTTTRVLLDSPVGSDPRLRDMLEDLELILAQVARLQAAPRPDELTFIAEAMSERDMVPRLRTVAAALSYSDY